MRAWWRRTWSGRDQVQLVDLSTRQSLFAIAWLMTVLLLVGAAPAADEHPAAYALLVVGALQVRLAAGPAVLARCAVAAVLVLLAALVPSLGVAVLLMGAAAALLVVGIPPALYAVVLPVVMLVGFAAGPLLGLGWAQALFTVVIALVFAQVAPSDWHLAEARVVDVAAGQIGGQALRLGLIDQVVVNQVPVVFGSGRPFFATGGLAKPLRLENPTTIVRGDRVTHLVYDVSH